MTMVGNGYSGNQKAVRILLELSLVFRYIQDDRG